MILSCFLSTDMKLTFCVDKVVLTPVTLLLVLKQSDCVSHVLASLFLSNNFKIIYLKFEVTREYYFNQKAMIACLLWFFFRNC